MPFTTYANQKTVQIHKPAMNDDFLQIQNADWMAVTKELGPYGLQLYLYLAANADGFSLSFPLRRQRTPQESRAQLSTST